jgi:hypothetical protein
LAALSHPATSLALPHSLLKLLHHGSPSRIAASLLKLRLLPSKPLRVRRYGPRVYARRQALLLRLTGHTHLGHLGGIELPGALLALAALK